MRHEQAPIRVCHETIYRHIYSEEGRGASCGATCPPAAGAAAAIGCASALRRNLLLNSVSCSVPMLSLIARSSGTGVRQDRRA